MLVHTLTLWLLVALTDACLPAGQSGGQGWSGAGGLWLPPKCRWGEPSDPIPAVLDTKRAGNLRSPSAVQFLFSLGTGLLVVFLASKMLGNNGSDSKKAGKWDSDRWGGLSQSAKGLLPPEVGLEHWTLLQVVTRGQAELHHAANVQNCHCQVAQTMWQMYGLRGLLALVCHRGTGSNGLSAPCIYTVQGHMHN